MAWCCYLVNRNKLPSNLSGSKWTPGDRLRVKEIRLKNLTFVSRLSRSLRVIRTDTYRSAIYDFLLTFHSNHGPISHRFRDKRRFQSKIATTKIPRRHWRAAWNFEEFHDWLIDWRIDTLGIGYRRLGSKTRMMGLRDRAEKEVWRYFSRLFVTG